MTDEARAAFLRGLADIVARHQGDPVTGGLEAVQQLNRAGASWLDVLPGLAFASDDHMLDVVPLGYRTQPRPIDCSRAIRTLLAWATPFELATWAVLISRLDPDFPDWDEGELLREAVKQLLARRVQLAQSVAAV